MKIKVKAEDFRVQEETKLRVSSRPRAYSVFQLTKRDWDTFDLIALLARRLRIPVRDIAFAGIKDRFGWTKQLITIRRRRGLSETIARLPEEKNFSLNLLGYCATPISAKDIRGNRFTITVRDIDPSDLQRYLENADIVSKWGVPNYYDEQRFGSARHGKGFIGKEVFLGRREQALRLYFEPSKYDKTKTRNLKACVTENWGRWEHCLDQSFGEYRRILAYLTEHRKAFHKALTLIDRRYFLFLLNAYQSFLFNRILSQYLESVAEEYTVALDYHRYLHGRFLFHRELPETLFRRLQRAELPVPGWNSRIEDPRIAEITARVLEAEGIELRDLKERQISRIYINGIERPALLQPESFSVTTAQDDELYKNRKKMQLEFFLPRGGYATLIVKRLAAQGRDSGKEKIGEE